MGAYALSKTALLGLTKLMALELGPRGVRVNCICPGLIETRFGEAVSCLILLLVQRMYRNSVQLIGSKNQIHLDYKG